MRTEVYAIRHNPTGEYMPCLMHRSGRGGWSFWNPGPVLDTYGEPHDKNPRIFFTKISARNALTMWLQGEWHRKQGVFVDWEGTPDGYDKMTVDAPSRPRVREDMEIVVLMLMGL